MPISLCSNGIMTSCHYDITKVVILGIEYRYRSLSSIEVSSIDVIAGIVLTLVIVALTLTLTLCAHVMWTVDMALVPTQGPIFPPGPDRLVTLNHSLLIDFDSSYVLHFWLKIKLFLLSKLKASFSIVSNSLNYNFPQLTYIYVVPSCVVTAAM